MRLTHDQAKTANSLLRILVGETIGRRLHSNRLGDSEYERGLYSLRLDARVDDEDDLERAL